MKRLLIAAFIVFGAAEAGFAQTCPGGAGLNISTTSPLPPGTQGTPYNATLTGAGGTSPYTWSVVSGSLPPGFNPISSSGATTGLISGSATGTGVSNFTVRITDSNSTPRSCDKAYSLTITSNPLTINTPATLPTATLNSSYSVTLSASGGVAPYTWTSNSALPPGLNLNSSSGVLSGTPTESGSFSIAIQVRDNSTPSPQTKSQTFTLTVGAPLTISTTTIPSATINSPYSVTFAATGGVAPYTWTLSGNSPPGLTMSPGGVLSGTPTSGGTYQITIVVNDSSTPSLSVTKNFGLSVSGALSLVTNTLANGAVGKAYTQPLSASGGLTPYNWVVPAGALPSGLSLSADGIISGTPTTPGTFSFTISVTDSSSSPQLASKTFTITIQPQLAITTTSLPTATVGAFFSQLMVANVSTNLTWSVVSGITPPGLSLSTSGALSGTPSVGGQFDFTVQVASTDPVQTATRAYHMVVSDALRIVTPATLPDAILGAPYTLTLEAAGGLSPYTWSALGRPLPAGLNLSASGVISGTPTGIGGFSFTIQVSDSFSPVQQQSRTFSLVVSTAVTITTTTLPNATKDLAYSQQLAATGSGPFTWLVTSGTLPTGLTLTPAGILQGTPTEVGAKTVTITVTDSRGASTAKEFTITVDPPVPGLSLAGLPASLTTRGTFDVSMNLASPHPSALSGTLKMTFTSNAEIASDDPATQFSNGTRTATFTIAANTTAAVFTSALKLLTGTVAGTVKMTATFDNGPTDAPVATIDIPATAPQITDITATRTSGGIDVQVTGFAPSRRVLNVEFTFDVRAGSTTQRPTLSRSVDAEFSAWYRNAASTVFGSSFSFLQSFTVTGDASAIQGVTIRLSNAQGSTTSQTVAPK